jgi:hypothetical protein
VTRFKLRHIAFVLLGAVGLYVASFLALFLFGLVAGFASTNKKPTQPTMIVRYVDRSATPAPAQSPP